MVYAGLSQVGTKAAVSRNEVLLQTRVIYLTQPHNGTLWHPPANVYYAADLTQPDASRKLSDSLEPGHNAGTQRAIVRGCDNTIRNPAALTAGRSR